MTSKRIYESPSATAVEIRTEQTICSPATLIAIYLPDDPVANADISVTYTQENW